MASALRRTDFVSHLTDVQAEGKLKLRVFGIREVFPGGGHSYERGRGSGAGRKGVWFVQECGKRQAVLCPSPPRVGRWTHSRVGTSGVRPVPDLPGALDTHSLPVLSADKLTLQSEPCGASLAEPSAAVASLPSLFLD